MIAKIIKKTGVFQIGQKVKIIFSNQTEPSDSREKYMAYILNGYEKWPLYDYEYIILPIEKYPEEYL